MRIVRIVDLRHAVLQAYHGGHLRGLCGGLGAVWPRLAERGREHQAFALHRYQFSLTLLPFRIMSLDALTLTLPDAFVSTSLPSSRIEPSFFITNLALPTVIVSSFSAVMSIFLA